MSEFFIYFRCWPGFKEDLPKRFNWIIDDKELEVALYDHAREDLWKRLPEIKAKRDEDLKRLTDHLQKRAPQHLKLSKIQENAKALRRREVCDRRKQQWPLIVRVGKRLGYFDGGIRPMVDGKVTLPRVWCSKWMDEGKAELHADVLSDCWNQNFRECYEPSWIDLRPYFMAVPADDFTAAQQNRIRFDIQRFVEEKAVPISPQLAASMRDWIGQNAMLVLKATEAQATPKPSRK